MPTVPNLSGPSIRATNVPTVNYRAADYSGFSRLGEAVVGAGLTYQNFKEEQDKTIVTERIAKTTQTRNLLDIEFKNKMSSAQTVEEARDLTDRYKSAQEKLNDTLYDDIDTSNGRNSITAWNNNDLAARTPGYEAAFIDTKRRLDTVNADTSLNETRAQYGALPTADTKKMVDAAIENVARLKGIPTKAVYTSTWQATHRETAENMMRLKQFDSAEKYLAEHKDEFDATSHATMQSQLNDMKTEQRLDALSTSTVRGAMRTTADGRDPVDNTLVAERLAQYKEELPPDEYRLLKRKVDEGTANLMSAWHDASDNMHADVDHQIDTGAITTQEQLNEYKAGLRPEQFNAAYRKLAVAIGQSKPPYDKRAESLMANAETQDAIRQIESLPPDRVHLAPSLAARLSMNSKSMTAEQVASLVKLADDRRTGVPTLTETDIKAALAANGVKEFVSGDADAQKKWLDRNAGMTLKVRNDLSGVKDNKVPLAQDRFKTYLMNNRITGNTVFEDITSGRPISQVIPELNADDNAKIEALIQSEPRLKAMYDRATPDSKGIIKGRTYLMATRFRSYEPEAFTPEGEFYSGTMFTPEGETSAERPLTTETSPLIQFADAVNSGPYSFR